MSEAPTQAWKADGSAIGGEQEKLDATMRVKVRRLKPEGGKGGKFKATYVRLVPAHVNMDGWYQQQSIHFGVGPNKRSILCNREMSDGQVDPCAVCEFAWNLMNSGQEASGKDLLPKWRWSVNVIVLKDRTGVVDEEDKDVYVWSMGRETFILLLDEVTSAGSDIAHPVTGRNVEIKRTGSDMDTKYKIKCAEASEFPQTDLFDDLYDLAEVTPMLEVKAQVALLQGGSADSGDPLKQVTEKAEAVPEEEAQPEEEPTAGGFAAEDDEPAEAAAEANGTSDAGALARLRDATK